MSRFVAVQEDERVILRINQERNYLVRARKGTTVQINRADLPLDALIGSPYGSFFQWDGTTMVRLTADPFISAVAADELQQAAPAEGFSGAQVIDDDAIVAARAADGTDGSEVISALMAGSASFQAKSAFAKEKWLRKKEAVHLVRFQLLRATPDELCRYYADSRHPERLLGLRPETLAMLLQNACLKPGAKSPQRVLVYDDTAGFITACVKWRLGASCPAASLDTTPVIVVTGSTVQRAARQAASELNADNTGTGPLVRSVPFHWLCAPDAKPGREAPGAPTSPSATAAAESTAPEPQAESHSLSAAAAPAAAESNTTTDAASAAVSSPRPVPSPFAAWLSPERLGAELAREWVRQSARSSGLASGLLDNALNTSVDAAVAAYDEAEAAASTPTVHEPFLADSVIVVSRADPRAILPGLLRHAKSGAAIVVYSRFLQPLAEISHALRVSHRGLILDVSDTFARPMQVLPGRTHPAMSAPAHGGYIFSCFAQLPNVAREVTGDRPAKRRRMNKGRS
jgi:tRNA (adenine-N(1)-)-methyltransferase non-catalytic subunit